MASTDRDDGHRGGEDHPTQGTSGEEHERAGCKNTMPHLTRYDSDATKSVADYRKQYAGVSPALPSHLRGHMVAPECCTLLTPSLRPPLSFLYIERGETVVPYISRPVPVVLSCVTSRCPILIRSLCHPYLTHPPSTPLRLAATPPLCRNTSMARPRHYLCTT